MAKYGFLSVLEEEMDQHFHYDYELNWDKKNHAIELAFLLEAQNQGAVATLDAKGEESSDDILFEDYVLFYNPAKSKFDAEDYLATIPYEPKKGLSREFLAYFAAFLNDTVTEGLSDLIDFLEDEEAEDFTIAWDAEAFENGRADLQETEFFGYPRY